MKLKSYEDYKEEAFGGLLKSEHFKRMIQKYDPIMEEAYYDSQLRMQCIRWWYSGAYVVLLYRISDMWVRTFFKKMARLWGRA